MVPQTAPGPFAANYLTQGKKKPCSFHHSAMKNLVLVKSVSTPAPFTREGEQLCERPKENKFLVGKMKI